MANPRLAPQYYQKNAITFQAHRRQVIWQIYAPIAVVILLVVITAILVILAPKYQTGVWADIALILLVSTIMVSALISIIFLIISIIGTRRVLQVMPYYLFMGQSFTFRLRSRLQTISDQAVEPVLWARSNYAKLQVFQPRRKRK